MNRKNFARWWWLALMGVVAAMTLVAFAQPPEILWTRTYGGSGSEGYFGVADVQQTLDGGYIIAGSTSSYGAGGHDAWVIKTDANGNSLWSHTFGSSGSDYARNVQQTTDGGYIIGGCYNWSYYSGDLRLIKTDPNGHEVWSSTFHRSVGNHAGFVQQTTDGGYVLFGHSGSYYIPGQYDWWLIKTDANGDSLWSRTYGGNEPELAQAVHQTQDGGYVLMGSSSSFSPFTPDDIDFWLLKTNADGDSLWSHSYNRGGYDIGRDVKQTSEGGYVLVGETRPYVGGGPLDIWLIKTDTDGEVEWDRTFGGSGDDYGFGVLQTEDGGYVVVGNTSSYGAGGYDMWLIKTDANGDSLWSCTAGGSGDEWGFGIDQTSDSGYVAVGRTNSFGAGEDDLYLVRLAAEQPPPDVTITLVPFVYPLQIPAAGGSFDFYCFVTNNEADTIMVDLWTKVILPNGSTLGPLMGPALVPLNPGTTGWYRSQNVPGHAPAGTYTYMGCLGDYPNGIWASDSFQFVKTSGSDGSGMGNWDNWGAPFDEQANAPSSTPATIMLHRAVPNPFNPTTALSFEIRVASHVSLRVYDTAGRLVSTLVDGWREAETHEVTFDGSGLPSGIYVYRLEAGVFTASGKMVLMK